MLDWYCGIVMLPYAVLFVISHYSMKRWNKNPLDLWPRVEQRKLVLEEKNTHNQKPNHQKINSTGRVTRKIKKTRKNKQNLHFPQFLFFDLFFFLFLLLVCCLFFVFYCFFLEFGFLVFLFALVLLFFVVFVKPYILCVAGLITLDMVHTIVIDVWQFNQTR
jgi:hypothetical protein